MQKTKSPFRARLPSITKFFDLKPRKNTDIGVKPLEHTVAQDQHAASNVETGATCVYTVKRQGGPCPSQKDTGNEKIHRDPPKIEEGEYMPALLFESTLACFCEIDLGYV